MSVIKNVEEITKYIQQYHPDLEFGNLGISNKAIVDICSKVLKKGNCKKTKKKLVLALNNINSSLRKSLDCESNYDVKNDSKFLELLQNNGYSKDDFCSMNNKVLNSVCRLLKITCNNKNRNKAFIRCQESFGKHKSSVRQVESFAKDLILLEKSNSLDKNMVLGVKRKLFDDCSPKKENSHEFENVVEKLNIQFKDDSVEKSEQDFIIRNPDLFNSPFAYNDDNCCKTRIVDTKKEMISVQEINKNEELITTPKHKLEIFQTRDLFTPEKSFKSIVVCNTPEADLKALPKNSKNVYPRNVRTISKIDGSKKLISFNKCTLVEGVIILQDDELKHIMTSTDQNNVIISDEVNDLLRGMFETVNNSCVLTIKNKNKTKKGLTCYGICRHETCKQFKLVVEKKTKDTCAQITVLSNSHDYSHSGKLTTFLKGKRREKQKQMSKYCPPMSLRQKYILKSSPSKLKRGNLGDIRSDRVYYKVSHEHKSRHDQANDDRVDMYLLKETCSEFIKYVSDPKAKDFETYLFSQEQLDVLIKMGHVEIHVDATGGVVRATTADPELFKTGKRKEKLLLYYAAVIVCNKRIIPIAEYLTTTQTASAITNWLTEFRKFYEQQCGTKFIAHVVSDFSTAILKAFVKAFNECNEVVEYLNKCYEFMFEGQTFECSALISLCCCHLIKNISDDAHKYYKKNENKITHGSVACLATSCISPAFNIITTELLDKWFIAVTTVFLSPFMTAAVESAMKFLVKLSNDSSKLVDERFKDSKFLARFENIAVQVKEQLTASPGLEKNQLYSVDFHNDIMGSIIPVIPMWTGVMRFRILHTMERASNAPAESWFGDLKTYKKCRRMKCGRFVKLTRNIILSRSKEVLLDIPYNYCAKRPVQKKEVFKTSEKKCMSMVELISSDNDEGEEKEHWQPRKKQKSFYFKGHLKAALKQLGSKIDVQLPPVKKVPNVSVFESFDLVQSDEIKTPNRLKLSESFVSVKSYKSPIDGQRSNMAVYENRLPKDVNYFGPVLKKNGKPLEYVVGIYNGVKDITEMTELYFSDYDTLSDYTTPLL